jgi:hypothetical protein
MSLARNHIPLGVGLLAVACVFGIGCGKVKHKIVEVQGKITFQDGKPVPAGTRLLFNPAGGGTGAACGIADAEGSFTVEHVTGRDGAEIGKYTVLLAAPEDNPGQFFELIPKPYYDGGAISVEVKEGMGPVELKVKNQPAGKGQKR